MKRSTIEIDEKFASEPGSRFKEKFHGVVGADGVIDLVSDGFEDIQKEIEAWQPSTEIQNIVARVSAGEFELLEAHKGFFGDVVGMPKTYAEMVQMMYNAEINFMKLPVEVRAEFNNDMNQYIAQYGSEEFYKKLEKIYNKDESNRSGSDDAADEKGE